MNGKQAVAGAGWVFESLLVEAMLVGLHLILVLKRVCGLHSVSFKLQGLEILEIKRFY